MVYPVCFHPSITRMDYRVKIFAFYILMAITEVWSLISLYVLYSCGLLPFKTDSQHFRHITVGRLYNFRQWRIGFIHSERREGNLIGLLSQCKFTLWNITWQLFEVPTWPTIIHLFLSQYTDSLITPTLFFCWVWIHSLLQRKKKSIISFHHLAAVLAHGI